MPVKIEFFADNAVQAADEILHFASRFGYLPSYPRLGAPIGHGEAANADAAVVGQAPAEPTKRTRRTKAEMEAERAQQPAGSAPAATTTIAATVAAEPAPAERAATEEELFGAPVAEPAKELNLDDARAALQKLNEAKGLDAARDFVLSFGVKRTSDLKPDQFGDFVARALAQAAA